MLFFKNQAEISYLDLELSIRWKFILFIKIFCIHELSAKVNRSSFLLDCPVPIQFLIYYSCIMNWATDACAVVPT